MSTGRVVCGRYRLEAEIGAGGMARVWRAQDLTLDRPVAVKFLFLREDRDQETMIERFLREARIAASVRHPNVVDVLDFGTIPEDGRPFMVMELLEGESLDSRLAREPTLGVRELVEILGAALEGLAAVHKVGIVHRDLKPDNLFLVDEDGGVRPKLLDFGVSRDTDPNSGRRSALTTNAGYLVGTPEYMSPEQARGLKDVDWRTDVYSVGVVLYEALTGELPYDAEAVGDLIIEIVGGKAPSVYDRRPEVGEPLSITIAKAMASERGARFQSAKEMREALLDAAAATELEEVRALVPARKRAAVSTAPSLDGSLAWGAGAVPSFGVEAPREAPYETLDEAPPESSSKRSTPWTVDTALPVAPRGSVLKWSLAAGALIVCLAGAAVWVALSPRPGPELSAPASPVGQSDRPTATETIADEPPNAAAAPTEVAEPTPSASVSVTLAGLPGDARVFVDDEATELEEGALELPRDEREHVIRVEAPRRRPWTTRHVADADGSYRVALRRRSGSSSRRGRTGSGVFRDLDY